MGYQLNVPESMANNMGYQALNRKRYKEAEYLFKLNVTNYPESSNVYDSLGDFYEARGEKDKAIDSFKKALSIKEVSFTREKLNKLETK
jgi:tetratricopeptide (TPR) repeat protein